jgi:hypothetical protein
MLMSISAHVREWVVWWGCFGKRPHAVCVQDVFAAGGMLLCDDILTTGGLKTQCRVSSAPCEHR